LNTAYQVPWERERQSRILRAVYLGQLQEMEKRPWRHAFPMATRDLDPDRFSREASRVGLPTADGPGSRLSARQWGQLMVQCWILDYYGVAGLQVPIARNQRSLHAAQLLIALVLYQADHGKPPARLDALVPAYLAELPIDPVRGQPFGYRISEGEVIELDDPARHRIVLAPGQALLWYEEWRPLYFPVPVWLSPGTRSR
jgi:hypothetical protein